jgi:hypothetical protein
MCEWISCDQVNMRSVAVNAESGNAIPISPLVLFVSAFISNQRQKFEIRWQHIRILEIFESFRAKSTTRIWGKWGHPNAQSEIHCHWSTRYHLVPLYPYPFHVAVSIFSDTQLPPVSPEPSTRFSQRVSRRNSQRKRYIRSKTIDISYCSSLSRPLLTSPLLLR